MYAPIRHTPVPRISPDRREFKVPPNKRYLLGNCETPPLPAFAAARPAKRTRAKQTRRKTLFRCVRPLSPCPTVYPATAVAVSSGAKRKTRVSSSSLPRTPTPGGGGRNRYKYGRPARRRPHTRFPSYTDRPSAYTDVATTKSTAAPGGIWIVAGRPPSCSSRSRRWPRTGNGSGTPAPVRGSYTGRTGRTRRCSSGWVKAKTIISTPYWKVSERGVRGRLPNVCRYRRKVCRNGSS